MLKSLLIENYALIDKLDISFDDGLTIITGETGAGKSILLGALSMILGQRADTRVLFKNTRKCVIEGIFDLKNMGIEKLFIQHKLDYEDNTIFRREINPQGKSRAFINDTPVNLNVMREIAEKLIDIHSQHQNLIIGKPSFRYDVLDAFAGLSEKVTNYKNQYEELIRQKKHLEALREKEKKVTTELDYHQFQYDELYKAGLNANEFEEIEQELEILNHATEIKLNLEQADLILQNNDENILSQLHEVIHLVKPFAKLNEEYDSFHQRLTSVEIELKDIAREIAIKGDHVIADPQRLNELQTRYDLLQKLMLKHHAKTIEELMVIRDKFKEKIQSFDSLELEIEKSVKEYDKTEKQIHKRAEEISLIRKKSIPGLEKQINALLAELGMPDGRFVISQKKQEHLNIYGADSIAFLFSANKGNEPQNLEKVASGGELSRLMLAIKSVISIKNLLPTIIFDEIDTGVSGEIGFKIGNILEKISSSMQVISVTHLPQVAAKGKKHFIVYKQIEGEKTLTKMKSVDEKERVKEIAKMLGGENPSDTVLETAKEMIDKLKYS
ncbi:MAG: DNA repair protein RecN [Bacteroidota bacterium]